MDTNTLNYEINYLSSILDKTMNIINNRLIIYLENDFDILACYYMDNIVNLSKKSFKINIDEYLEKYNMSEGDIKDLYKYIIQNNRGYDLLYNLIEKKYNIKPCEHIINNIIHYYIEDILQY